MSLITEQNTTTAQRKIARAARTVLKPAGHRRLEVCFEHGQHWVTCLDCGAQWSADDSTGPAGFEFEEVTRGDETCS